MDNPENLPRPEPSAQPAAPRRSGIYYGWFLLAAAMIISAVAVGVRDSFELFKIPWTVSFGLSSFQLEVPLSAGAAMGGFTLPILGYLFDRLNSRRVILISIAVGSLAIVCLSMVPGWWHMVVLFGVVHSTALNGASFGVLGPLAARWFLRRRTLALALLLVSPTLGSLFLNPITSYVIALYGWRNALLVLGAILLFLALPVGLKFLRTWPSEMGLKADGEPESPSEASMRGSAPAVPRGRFEVVSWRQAFRSPPYLVLLPTLAIGGFAVSFVSQFLLLFPVDPVNVTLTEAAIVPMVMTILGVIGALLGCWLSERFPRKKVLGAAFLAQGIAFLVLIAVQTPAGLWTFAVLAGLSGTVWMLLAFLLIADIYGLRALGTLWGIAFLSHFFGIGIGNIVSGLAIELTGSHLFPVSACALMLIIASVMVFAVDERKYSPRYYAAAGGAVGI